MRKGNQFHRVPPELKMLLKQSPLAKKVGTTFYLFSGPLLMVLGMIIFCVY